MYSDRLPSSSRSQQSSRLRRSRSPSPSKRIKVEIDDSDFPSYYCRICKVDCNSDVMLENHVQGKNHKKKLKQKLNDEEGPLLDHPVEEKDVPTFGDSAEEKLLCAISTSKVKSRKDEKICYENA